MSDPSPKPSRFKSTKMAFDVWKRMGELRTRIIDAGGGMLPPAYRAKLQMSLRDRSNRHKSVGLSVVVDLALDALEDVCAGADKKSADDE